MGIPRHPFYPAAVDPFRPGRFIIIYLGSALAQDRPSVAW